MSNASWGVSSIQPGSDNVVTLMLAGPVVRATAWSQLFQVDSRFRVATLAFDTQDLITKLSYNPEAIILDATMFSTPDELIQILTRIQAAVYLVVPPGLSDDVIGKLRSANGVQSITAGDINLADITAKIMRDVHVQRQQAPAIASSSWGGAQQQTIGGFRIITVWSRAGGVGKSTLAISLAQDAAQRGLRTLLIGLACPDITIPTILKLNTNTNISTFMARPDEDGFKQSIQKSGNLDVIVGLQDSTRDAELFMATDAPASINALTRIATFGGYAAVIMDTPVGSNVYQSAISASNTLVMVSEPRLDHAIMAAEAHRVIFKRLAGQHHVGAGNVFVVLNRVRNGLLSPNDWHAAATTFSQSVGMTTTFPPVAVTIPEVDDVAITSNSGRSPMTAGENFARSVHKLSDILFGGGPAAGGSSKSGNKKSLFGISIKG